MGVTMNNLSNAFKLDPVDIRRRLAVYDPELYGSFSDTGNMSVNDAARAMAAITGQTVEEARNALRGVLDPSQEPERALNLDNMPFRKSVIMGADVEKKIYDPHFRR